MLFIDESRLSHPNAAPCGDQLAAAVSYDCARDASASHLHARTAHSTRRRRVGARLQGDSARHQPYGGGDVHLREFWRPNGGRPSRRVQRSEHNHTRELHRRLLAEDIRHANGGNWGVHGAKRVPAMKSHR